MPEERLQKILSRAGVTSRRKAETLIVEGRVTVNGTAVTELGSKADLERDHIKVDGKLLHAPRRMVYIALNKPVNFMTTVSDPVGRLDYHSEGLLLFTNDGEFANGLTSASSNISKTYLVKVNGLLTSEQEEQFRHGVPMEGRMTAPAGLKMIRRAVNPWYEVRLVEGRKNQIRVMFKHFGRLVEKLKRVKIGFLELGPLKPGAFRHLSPEEIERFRRLTRRRVNGNERTKGNE